ncbi:MAG: hypothetical protein RR058_08260 [Oscillospiraceae bacterium]
MGNDGKKINIGIGFVTGRKNFKRVLKSYLDNWNESGLLDRKKFALHLFVAYDLKYLDTEMSDYNITEKEILGTVASAYYLGNASIANEARMLVEKKVVGAKEAKLIFGEGYAMKRNAVLYFALKNKMDYLIFLDDDEYPIANIRMKDSLVWKGQEVLASHIKNIPFADMTHGHHCGYVSPIPEFDFNDKLSEDDFKIFIEAISNDIVNWDSIKTKMEDGGVTYAKLSVIDSTEISTVKEIGGMKFISGANLGFNLKNPDKIFPFYNPPGARGEDTFLSTCIGECSIRKIPCYTFHDGYSAYQRLLLGILPNRLRAMSVHSGAIYKRFYKAAVGWIRYKPLLLYITKRDVYEAEIARMRKSLEDVIPKFGEYFGNDDFRSILTELEFYHAHVCEHFADFEKTKTAWHRVVTFLGERETVAGSAKRDRT